MRRRSPRPGSFAPLAALCLALAACGGGPQKTPDKPEPVPLDPPVAEAPPALTGLRDAAPPILIRGVTLLTADPEAPRIERGWIRVKDGLIAGMGEGDGPAPADGERLIEGRRRVVTPGLIDTHSHLGVYAAPHTWAHADGNEMTGPITAGVRAEDAFWPQDPGIQRAVAGGVTTIMALPGSGNLMGGRGVVLKLHPAREARAMRFPGAQDGLKMACGENPKRVYGQKGAMPMSRMGSAYLMRDKFMAARRYQRDWAEWRANPEKSDGGEKSPKVPPKRDLVLETLAAVLDGDIRVHIHCYRADEMLLQLGLAEEFGYPVASFHHATEAYKIRDVLAARGVGVSTWADWWGFKVEAWDAIEQNLALTHMAGGLAIVHSDSARGIQRLNQEAAKGLAAGLHAGLKPDPGAPEGITLDADAALRWITINPARALGIDDRTGSLAPGKMADLVLWDRDPLSVYARAELVLIDGHVRHDAAQPQPPWSDFEVGLDAGLPPVDPKPGPPYSGPRGSRGSRSTPQGGER